MTVKIHARRKSLAFMPVSNSDAGFDRAFLTSESLGWMPAQRWSSGGVRKL